jgi:hypothetical protein
MTPLSIVTATINNRTEMAIPILLVARDSFKPSFKTSLVSIDLNLLGGP